MSAMAQLSLFGSMLDAYASVDRLPNAGLYERLIDQGKIDKAALEQRAPIGQAKAQHSPVKRKIRWFQQTLKTLGLLKRVPGERGIWQLTDEGRKGLHRPKAGVALLGFSTDLGIGIWAPAEQVYNQLDEPIHLCLTSLPYPLAQPRAYGNPVESEYVDFVCRILEPIVRQLAPGASVALNCGNDIFIPNSPARSLYQQRMVLALHDRFGLELMDTLIWHNPSKPPGPFQWASKQRMQLNVAYEPVYWFTNNPRRCLANNQRVLQPHTEKHLQLIQRGGEMRNVSNSDGAYRILPGAYGNPTAGRIPRNVMTYGHANAEQRALNRRLREMGLPTHGAPMPGPMAAFLIEFMTEPGQLVVDPCAGSFTTAGEAEKLGRRWLATEWILEYVRGGAERLRNAQGFWMNPCLRAMG